MTIFCILHPLIQPVALCLYLIRRIPLLISETCQELVPALKVLYFHIKLLAIGVPLILMVESSDSHDSTHA